jgi:hypothetical protein
LKHRISEVLVYRFRSSKWRRLIVIADRTFLSLDHPRSQSDQIFHRVSVIIFVDFIGFPHS